MIMTILVPATGSDTDAGVLASALIVARPFGAHLGFLHISIDAGTFAATIMPEVSSGQVFTDVINRLEEETRQREQKAKQLFESFCRREGLVVSGTSSTCCQCWPGIGATPTSRRCAATRSIHRCSRWRRR